MEIEEEIASYLQEKSTKLIVTHSHNQLCVHSHSKSTTAKNLNTAKYSKSLTS